jgi:hypothetical protein
MFLILVVRNLFVDRILNYNFRAYVIVLKGLVAMLAFIFRLQYLLYLRIILRLILPLYVEYIYY